MSSEAAMSLHEAEQALDGIPLVPCTSGSLADIKRLRDQCLSAGIPAIAAAPSPGRG
jgi:predicted mannosyl-3-phosphoglycerate phosphatase (HAD superfamily)